jgi:methylmalonyl-CoA mutase C-terminal domain/subunit
LLSAKQVKREESVHQLLCLPFSSMEEIMNEKPIRVLIAKPGLDGHDRGAKVVAHALREAGMEAIYTGLHQTVEQIVEAALQEDVDAIGLSILSGAHLPITQKMMGLLVEQDMADVPVVVGGNIPQRDIEKLKALGVAGVFPTATPFEDIVGFIREKVGGGS